MPVEIRDYKVTSLPARPKPNSRYYLLKSNDTVEEYLTDVDGNLRLVNGPSSINISAGAVSTALDTIIFSNSNNVSFGLSGSTITASIAGGGGGTEYFFSSSNGISFGTNGSTVTASYTVPTQSIQTQGTFNTTQLNNYQLTANNSLFLDTSYTSHTHSQYVNTSVSSLFLTSQSIQTQGTFNTTQLGDYQLTANNSLSLGTEYTSHTHSQYFNTSQSSLLLLTNQSSLFQQTSQMSDYLDTNYTTHTHSQYLTSQTQFILSNSNGISFGTNGSTITASYTTPTDYVSTGQSSLFQQTSQMSDYLGANYTSHTHSQYLNTSQSSLFEQSSHTTLFLTSQSAQALSGSNGSFTFQTATLGNLNGLSFYTSNGSMVGSYSVPTDYVSTGQSSLFQQTSQMTDYLGTGYTTHTHSQYLNTSQSSLFQHTSATSAITSNAFNTSGSSNFVLTANSSLFAHTSAMTSKAGIGVTTAGGVGLSATLNTNGLSISIPSWLTTAMASNRGSDFVQANAAFAGTNASGTIASNGISVSVLSQSNQTLGAYAVSNTTQSSSGTIDARSLSFHGAGIASVGISNGSVIISVPSGGGAGDGYNILAAGTQTANTTGTVVFSNSNGISFGMNNSSVITASVDAVAPRNFYNPYGDLVMVAGQVGQGTLNINPNVMPSMTFDRVYMPINNTNSSNSSGSHTLSFWLGIYTLNVSTLSLVTSQSTSTALTHSGTAGSYSLYSGMRHLSMGISTSLSEGRYYIGIVSRTTSGGTNGSYSQMLVSNLNTNFLGHFGSSHNTTVQFQPGLGVYSVTTSGIPSSIGLSQVRGSDSAVLRPPILIFANSTI